MSGNLIALQNKFLGQGQTVYDVLGRLHEQQGFIGDSDIQALSQRFELPAAHVRATAKFYDELGHSGPAEHTLQVCIGEACRAAGCDAVLADCQAKLGVKTGQVSPEGIRLEPVACVGYCGLGPNGMVDGQPVRLAPAERLEAVVQGLRAGVELKEQEPTNSVHVPGADEPCVLLRRVDRDVVTLQGALADGVYEALRKAVTTMSPQQVIDEVQISQLRGRGGAGFLTGIKFQTVADHEAPDGSERKFVVVNFDEGDAGSYIDKELIERDPHGQLEAILLAAYAVGAQAAYIYARREYPRAQAVLDEALGEARGAGLIGAPLFGSDFACDVHVVRGKGAYICGEETSLLRSIEGVPALVSIRPPFPAQEGLWGCPTAVNNVETLHNLPWIVEHGGQAYAPMGRGRSRGTKAVSLNSRVRRPGLYEVEMGTTLRQIIFELAGGMVEGTRFKGVQVGGPLGAILPESALDTPLDFEAMAEQGAIVGHAGMVVYCDADDLVRVARGLMHFCAVESCGKCFPCRIGSVRGTELFDQMIDDGVTEDRVTLMKDLCETMKYGSLCAMGSMTPAPIESVFEHFPEELDRYRREDAV